MCLGQESVECGVAHLVRVFDQRACSACASSQWRHGLDNPPGVADCLIWAAAGRRTGGGGGPLLMPSWWSCRTSPDIGSHYGPDYGFQVCRYGRL